MCFKAFVLHVFLYLFNTKQNICNHICFTLSDLFNSRLVAHKDKSRCVITHVTPRFPTDLANSPLWSILTDLTRKDRWQNGIVTSRVSCCPIDKFLASLGWSNQWNDSFSAPTVIQTKLQALPPSAHQPNIHRHDMLCPDRWKQKQTACKQSPETKKKTKWVKDPFTFLKQVKQKNGKMNSWSNVHYFGQNWRRSPSFPWQTLCFTALAVSVHSIDDRQTVVDYRWGLFL